MASFCGQCGTAIPAGAGACPNCGTAVKGAPEQRAGQSRQGQAQATQPTQTAQTTQASQTAQPTQAIPQQQSQGAAQAPYTTPNGPSAQYTSTATPSSPYPSSSAAAIADPNAGMPVLSAGEYVIRHYQCSAIKHPRVAGFLTVTNKRLIFHGKSSSSRIVRDIPLIQVDGFDSFYGMNLKLGRIILGVLLALVGLMTIAIMLPLGLLLLVLGVVLIVFGIKRSYFLTIRIGDPGGRFELGSGPDSTLGNGSVYALASDPGPDVDAMLNELGALVDDIKSGDQAAIERWGRL